MTKENPIRLVILMLFIPFAFNSCTNTKEKAAVPGITEGAIAYQISYPQNLSSNPLSFLFPTEMIIYFEGPNQKAQFKNNLSLYNLEFIHNSKYDSVFTLLKILEKKVYAPSGNNSNIFLFNGANANNLIFNKDSLRNIAGFDCLQAIYTPDKPGLPHMTIWYTNQIGIEKPNRNTPFEVIPGLMLEFEILYQNVVFHLKASSVTNDSLPEGFFEIPPNYERTTMLEVESLIKSVISY